MRLLVFVKTFVAEYFSKKKGIPANCGPEFCLLGTPNNVSLFSRNIFFFRGRKNWDLWDNDFYNFFYQNYFFNFEKLSFGKKIWNYPKLWYFSKNAYRKPSLSTLVPKKFSKLHQEKCLATRVRGGLRESFFII